MNPSRILDGYAHPNVVCPWKSFRKSLQSVGPALTMAVLRYLNLSSEEFYLSKRGYLS